MPVISSDMLVLIPCLLHLSMVNGHRPKYHGVSNDAFILNFATCQQSKSQTTENVSLGSLSPEMKKTKIRHGCTFYIHTSYNSGASAPGEFNPSV